MITMRSTPVLVTPDVDLTTDAGGAATMADAILPTKRVRFTKTTVRALPIPLEPLAVTWDTELAGFGVRVSQTGRKTFFVQARTKAGRAIKITIGTFPVVTPEQARDTAEKHLAAIALAVTRQPSFKPRAKPRNFGG
jgi:hypothetical protein